MRISDWSSDVCSSDLLEITADALADFSRRRVDAIILQDSHGVAQAPPIARLLGAFPCVLIVSDAPVVTRHDLIVHDRLAALRASASHLFRPGRRRPAYCLSSSRAEPGRSKRAALDRRGGW